MNTNNKEWKHENWEHWKLKKIAIISRKIINIAQFRKF